LLQKARALLRRVHLERVDEKGPVGFARDEHVHAELLVARVSREASHAPAEGSEANVTSSALAVAVTSGIAVRATAASDGTGRAAALGSAGGAVGSVVRVVAISAGVSVAISDAAAGTVTFVCVSLHPLTLGINGIHCPSNARRGFMVQTSRTPVAGYVRVSTEQQAGEGVSLDAQRTKLNAYAVAMDLDLVTIFEDAGLSAKSLARPGLQAALAALEDGKASGLVVVKLDRLTRSVRDLGDLVDRYFSSRFALLSLSDSIDTRTASGRLVLHVLGAVSQWEREATAERTRDALAQLRADGVRLGAEPLGWRRSEAIDASGRRRCEEAGEERETIERVRELRRQGLVIKDIVAALEAEGRQTKRGARWHRTTIHRILRRSEEQVP
jgi:DNA invertase Pin-like site-specific DNA recombinase